MAFADWSDEDAAEFHDNAFINIFNEMDEISSGMLTNEQIEQAEELFELGFTNFNADYEERMQAQIDFYELLGIPYYLDDYGYPWSDEFDWETYRELYDSVNG